MSADCGMLATSDQTCGSNSSGTIGSVEDEPAEQACYSLNAYRSLDGVSEGSSASTYARSCTQDWDKRCPAENSSSCPKPNSFRGSAGTASKEVQDCLTVTSPYLLRRKGGISQTPGGGKRSPFEVMLTGARDFRSKGLMSSSPQVSGFASECSLVRTKRSSSREKTKQSPEFGGFLDSSSSNKSVFVRPRLQAPAQSSAPFPMSKTMGTGRNSRLLEQALKSEACNASRGTSFRLLEQALKSEASNPSSLLYNLGSSDTDLNIRARCLHGMLGREKPMEINCNPINAISSLVPLPSHSVNHMISHVKDVEEPHVFHARRSAVSDTAGCSPAYPVSPASEKLVERCKGIPLESTEDELLEVGERKVEGQPHEEKKSLSLMAKLNRKLKNIMSKGACKAIRESARLIWARFATVP
eukprot:gene15731-21853_t